MKKNSRSNLLSLVFLRSNSAATLIKELFNKNNYKNSEFFKAVIISLLSLFLFSSISAIYFTHKVYNFVTKGVGSTFNTARQEIDGVNGVLDRMSYDIFDGPQDERRIADQLQKKADEEHRIKVSKQKIEKAKEIADWLSSLEMISLNLRKQIDTPLFKSLDDLKYFFPKTIYHRCHEDIVKWRNGRAADLEIKKLTAEKYKEQLARKKSMDTGELSYKKEYIQKVAEYDLNTDPRHLIQILKERPADELVIDIGRRKSYVDLAEIEVFKTCQAQIEILLPAYIKYWFEYDEMPSYQKMKEMADNLYIEAEDIDFTVPQILQEEIYKIRSVTHHSEFLQNFTEVYARNINNAGFTEERQKVLAIFEETNAKLAEVNPDNPGFKYNGYKWRMAHYNYWQNLMAKVNADNDKKAKK